MWRCYASRSKIKVINEDLFHALWVDYDVDWRFVPFVNCATSVTTLWKTFEISNCFLGSG